MPGIQFFFFAAIALLTLAAAAHFAFRPTERRLSVVRPLCAATLSGGVASFLMGVANGLIALQHLLRAARDSGSPPAVPWDVLLNGFAESLAPLVIAFGGVAVAWLLVAAGLRRQT
jgi:hypothetical protein